METSAGLSMRPEESAAAIPAASGKRILIVDDQADERSIQRAMLEHRGFHVLEAEDGEMALEMTREFKPDLILLDIAMPKMDGISVCQALRAAPETADVVVLFYTASPEEDWMERVREVRASGVLGKPLDPHAVADEVEKLIGPPAS